MNRRGFTLVELSIVLVIIGLVIGGIFVGQDMIKQSQFRALISETERYQTAVRTFQTKYNCLPGDCANATDFFGTNGSCPSSTAAGGTCNGDGNGKITGNSGINQYEPSYMWQQLALAGLIPGNYLGYVVACCNTKAPIPRTGCPLSAVGYICPMVWYIGDLLSGIPCPTQGFSYGNWCPNLPPPPRHIMQYGNYALSSLGEYPSGIWTGTDLLALDTKIDDGFPFTGNVQTMQAYMDTTGATNWPSKCAWNTTTHSTTSYSYNTSSYNTSSGSLTNCPVFFVLNF